MSRPSSGHKPAPKTISTTITYATAPKPLPVHINAAPSNSDVSYEDVLVAQYLDELKKAKYGKQR